MTTKDEVLNYLKQFKAKTNIFQIVFRDDRGKNMQTLLDLEITRPVRKDIVMSLELEDYVDGPLEDSLNRINDMWVFGKEVKGREVYIKISMGYAGCSTICISFHIAEHKLKYKFK